jgi:hypothetical protein
VHSGNLLVVLVVALLAGPSAADQIEGTSDATTVDDQAASPEQLEKWLAGLDSDFYAEREQATDALLAAGGVAVPYLKRAAHGDSLEAADRAVWVLQQFAETADQVVQLAALEALVATERFPAIAREADIALAEFQSKLCNERFAELGAEFLMRSDPEYTGAGITAAMNIKVNTNRAEWTGEASDLMLLTKLRRVGKLTIASQLLDDKRVVPLAQLEGLDSLTLIETSVSGEMIEKLKAQHPELRVIVHTRAKLGVQFIEGQPLTVTMVLRDSPAEKAGMRAGDHVTKFDGQPVTSFDRLTALIAEHPPGKNVDITVQRGNEELLLSAQLDGTDWWEELKDR